jgi:hypothetical protein
MITRSFAVCLLLFLIFDVSAQTKKSPAKKPVVPVPEIVEGFWLVTKVSVGTREVTPVGRWFKIEKGKQVSGNGWTQHSFGTYKFDKKKSELVVITTNEPEDEYGPFKVERKGNVMTWSRKEEGEMVVVELKPTTELPINPSDEAKGLWVLTSALDRELDVMRTYDPDHKHFLFIRWDHQYVRQINAHERISGYWFFDAIRPELTLISEHREQADERWTVTITGNKMTLKGSSENIKEMTLSYSRATEFPK